MIPFADPGRGINARWDAVNEAVTEVLRSGQYVLGAPVSDFESAFAESMGVGGAVGVASGTDALHLALSACGVGRGHEVITASHTAVATVAAIEMTGAQPVLVEIDPETYTLDPNGVANAITGRTRAVVPVHLYGHPADMDAIMVLAEAHGLWVVEDCAQAVGATIGGRCVGGIGHVGCFSFYPTKNLGCAGDGGMVVSNQTDLLDHVRAQREYGWTDQRYVSAVPGRNARLDAIQAAILNVMLPHLTADNLRRNSIARRYTDALSDLELTLPQVRDGCDHVYHLYVVRTPDRDGLRERLDIDGVGTGIHYPVPIHCQPAYRHLAGHEMPETENAAASVLSLPMFPSLGDEEVERVIAALRRAMR